MLLIYIGVNYCTIHAENFSDETISKICNIIAELNLRYSINDNRITVSEPTYELMYNLTEMVHLVLE